jgi:hypothetical protein
MERQSQTFNGLISTLIDNVSGVARAVGQELLPFFKDLATVGIDVVKAIGDFVSSNKEAVEQVGKFVLIAGGVAGLLAGIGAAAMTASLAIGGITSAITALSMVAGTLSIVVSPVGAVVALFAAAGVAAWTFRDELWEVMKEIRSIWKEGVQYLSKTWNEMILGIKPTFESALNANTKKAAATIAKAEPKKEDTDVKKSSTPTVPSNDPGELTETEEERAKREMDEAIIAAEDAILSKKAQENQFGRRKRHILKFGPFGPNGNFSPDPTNSVNPKSHVSRVNGAFTAAAALALGGKRNDALDRTASNTAELVKIGRQQLRKKGLVFE